ncbi:hypothetical protein Q4E93_22955 [Flavitalea sp. BT771]|uniref:hypothetical protein n=1 Tax=Flavitalea sp. BT771 TaxID=3063329 RepID=UPI0026E39AEC|nr:hypothetical protein [Flavitalea sp. BT771]MDO6433491.1 hypothetical protein [Flavitalea sp. BT771]MDV6222604.1 hypothetical protein [Flavitalea sp. BT771]
MKNGYFFPALVAFSFVMNACSKKDSASGMLPPRDFGRANTIAFYLFDENGTNLVEKYGKTIALSYPQDTANSDFSRDIEKVIDDKGRSYLHIFFRGFKNSLSSRFTLTIPEHSTDQVSIRYKLITDGVLGGPFAADIESLLYNEVKVYSDTDGRPWSGRVVVTKRTNKTTVATNF